MQGPASRCCRPTASRKPQSPDVRNRERVIRKMPEGHTTRSRRLAIGSFDAQTGCPLCRWSGLAIRRTNEIEQRDQRSQQQSLTFPSVAGHRGHHHLGTSQQSAGDNGHQHNVVDQKAPQRSENGAWCLAQHSRREHAPARRARSKAVSGCTSAGHR